MKKEDQSSNEPSESVTEHPLLKKEAAFALYLARCHAHNHGKPPPDPATIGPAVFTRLMPQMSRDQMVENLIAPFDQRGIKVDRDK